MADRRRVTAAVVAAALAAVVPGATAGKPSGGGGTGGGTLYFEVLGATWSMASDGSGKTQLPAGVSGAPSRALHGGHRWFLASRAVAGTHPDGSPRHETFAVRDDGAVDVALTDDPSVRVFSATWARDDGAFSFSAVEWPAGGSPVSAIRRVALAYDGAGTPSPAGAAVLVVAAGVETTSSGEVLPAIQGPHDWDAAGRRVAWCDGSGPADDLFVTDVSTGATTRVAGGSWPAWSPDDSTLAFTGAAGIEAVAPDGSGRRTLVRSGSTYGVHRATWSPTGSHLAYWRYGVQDRSGDVYRATATGSSRTDLTADLSSPALPRAWR